MSVKGYQKYSALFDIPPLTEDQWSRIKVLTLSNLRIGEFDFDIVPDQIESLNLSGNRIRSLTIPSRLKSLEVLIADDNGLEELGVESSSPRLRGLSLTGNKLRTLKVGKALPKLSRLIVKNNPDLSVELCDLARDNISRLDIRQTSTRAISLSRGVVID